MIWKIVYTKHAHKDAKKLASSHLKTKAAALLKILAKDPFQTPPPYEKLVGDLTGACSRSLSDYSNFFSDQGIFRKSSTAI